MGQFPTTPNAVAFTANTLLDGGAPSVTALSYNGWVFPPASSIKAKVEPVYGDSKAVVIAHELSLEISFVLFPGMLGNADSLSGAHTAPATAFEYDAAMNSTTDEAVETARRALSQNGKTLNCYLQGYGDIQVRGRNSLEPTSGIFTLLPPSNTRYDIDNGPKTAIGEIVVIGKKAARMKVTIVARFRPCQTVTDMADNTTPIVNIIDSPFEIRSSYSEHGFLTRSISGKHKTFQVKPGYGVPPRSADDYRDVLEEWFPPLKKFQRTYNLTLSQDRTELTYEITDTECQHNQYPLYPHMVRMDLKYRLSSSLDDDNYTGFMGWKASLSGTITVAPTVSKMRGWFVFLDILFRLILQSKNGKVYSYTNGTGIPSVDVDDVATLSKDGTVILETIELEDNLYSQDISISVGWRLTCDLEKLFIGSGMFFPLPNAEVNLPGFPNDEQPYAGKTIDQLWEEWSEARKLYQKTTGLQPNIRFRSTTDDAIFDVCAPPQFPINSTPKVVNTYTEQFNLEEQNYAAPSPADSYMEAYQEIITHQTHNQHAASRLESGLSPVTEVPVANAMFASNTGLSPSDAGTTGSGAVGQTFAAQVFSAASKSAFDLTVQGYITRIGYRPHIPRLLSYGGQAVTPIGHAIVKTAVTGQVAKLDGKLSPKYQTTYIKKYRVHGRPVEGLGDSALMVTDGHPAQIHRPA